MLKKEPVTFTILNRKGEEVTIKATKNNSEPYLYRGGVYVKCNCTPPEGELNYFMYNNGRVYCPCCGREAVNVKTKDNIHLIPVGLDNNTMQMLYRLSDTVDYNIWLTIADCFVKLKPEDVDLDYTPSYVGWVTAIPELVEAGLSIREDLQVINRDIQAELNEIIGKYTLVDNAEWTIDNFDIVDKLHEVFSVVETPPGQFQLYNPDGFKDYTVENPLFPPNPRIGTGEFWLVREEVNEIWYVRYNYRDGDDLRFNNVLIDGELRAIGKVISYDKDVEELLQKLKK